MKWHIYGLISVVGADKLSFFSSDHFGAIFLVLILCLGLVQIPTGQMPCMWFTVMLSSPGRKLHTRQGKSVRFGVVSSETKK